MFDSFLGFRPGLRAAVEIVEPFCHCHQGLLDKDQTEVTRPQGVHQNSSVRYDSCNLPGRKKTEKLRNQINVRMSEFHSKRDVVVFYFTVTCSFSYLQFLSIYFCSALDVDAVRELLQYGLKETDCDVISSEGDELARFIAEKVK